MKILLTGRTGQLGVELARVLPALGTVIAPDREEMNLLNPARMREIVRRFRPDVIVNPAAYTQVDKAESESDLAMRINAEAPGILAEEAARLGAMMIQYSTDYVFDGSKETPYEESDAPNPQNVYGRSKLAGERAVAHGCPAHWIFRCSWIYGVHGGNFMKTILNLAEQRDSLRIVADQHGAPTWARTIAQATVTALRFQIGSNRDVTASSGIYHLCAGGSTTWHDYATHVVSQALALGHPLRLRAEAIEAIASEDYPQPARRPKNSRLDTKKLKATFGITLPLWQEDADVCLAELCGKA